MTDDAVDASIRVHLFLDRHFVLGPCAKAAARADIQAFGVLAEHDEVDVAPAAVLQRTETIVEQTDRAIVHVQIELEPRPQEDVARVAIVGHARIAERADEDRVEGAQRVVAAGWNGDAGLEVIVGAPRQRLELEAAEGRENGNDFGHDVPADPVPGNDGDAVRHLLPLHGRAANHKKRFVYLAAQR